MAVDFFPTFYLTMRKLVGSSSLNKLGAEMYIESPPGLEFNTHSRHLINVC